MARLLKSKRQEIWITDLIPGKGWEVAKKRPCIIISANEFNKISPLVIVIPISSNIPRVIGPERIFLEKEASNLKKNSVALVNQIKTIDKSRLIKRIGVISEEKLSEVEEALKIVLGLEPLE